MRGQIRTDGARNVDAEPPRGVEGEGPLSPCTLSLSCVIRSARRFTEAVPYVSAIIGLDGTQDAGARIQANVIDCDPNRVRIGDRVRVAFE